MYYPLVVLAVFAVVIGWPWIGLTNLLDQARPEGTTAIATGALLEVTHPSELDSHLDTFHVPAELWAVSTGLAGFLLAVAFYGLRILNPNEVRSQFKSIYHFLIHKWYFDELYDFLFVRPVLFASRRVAQFDRNVIDVIVDSMAVIVRLGARLDDVIDRYFVDGLVNWSADRIYAIGVWFRGAETGQLRQYVLFIVICTVALFVLISLYVDTTLAGF
jgi:NADH-quinone oxidoreductase subunit L